MRITLSIALLFVAAPLSAQGYVGGFVLDSATRAPLPCIQVALLDTAGRAVVRQLTLDDGAFQFDAPPRGTYRLAFALWSHEPLITASEELDPTVEHARTYALNFPKLPDSTQYADSAADAPPVPIFGAGKPPALPHFVLGGEAREYRATFNVLVDSTGKAVPSSVKVTSSTHPKYGENVEKWLKQARFKPARMDHRPVCGLLRDAGLVTHIGARDR
jgi:hypothetical protein